MDSASRELFSSIIQNDLILEFLEMSDFIKFNDLILLDYPMISRIEKYIGQCLSNEIPDKLRLHLSDNHRKNPENFKFDPLSVIRIRRAANLLHKKINSNEYFQYSLSGDVDDPKTNGNESSSSTEDVSTVLDKNRFNNSFLDNCISMSTDSGPPSRKLQLDNGSSDIKPILPSTAETPPSSFSTSPFYGVAVNSDNGLVKTKEILGIANRIQHHAKVYFNANVEYKKDFDIDFEYSSTDESGDTKKSGIFVCMLCRSVKGGASRIRFNITNRNYYVLSNVSTHLSKHFLKAPRTYNFI